MHDLNERLEYLKRIGCYPCLSYRGGDIWRAHINACGNYWAEHTTPLKALDLAEAVWRQNGCPMDGLGVKP